MEGVVIGLPQAVLDLPPQHAWVGLGSLTLAVFPMTLVRGISYVRGLKTVRASSIIAAPSLHLQALRYGPCLFPSGSQAAAEAPTGEPAWSHVHMRRLGLSSGPPHLPLAP